MANFSRNGGRYSGLDVRFGNSVCASAGTAAEQDSYIGYDDRVRAVRVWNGLVHTSEVEMKRNAILIIGLVLCGMALWPPANDAYALGQRLAVKYIRAIASDAELTPAQAENLTPQQAATYILANYPEIPAAKLKEAATYWPGIKIMLMNDAVERRTVERLALLKQQLLQVYPNAVGLDSQTAKDIGRQLLPLLYGEVDPNALD